MKSKPDLPPGILRLLILGATPEQLAAGLVAARSALDYARLDPAEGARAYAVRTAWRREEGRHPSEAEFEAAAIFTVAQMAAFDLAIGENTPRPEGARLIVDGVCTDRASPRLPKKKPSARLG